MDQAAIRKRLQAEMDQVNELILRSLDSDIDLLNRTNRSLLERPGKQLRPVLALLVARSLGGRVNEDTLRFAAASELLHNATLLHDDVADGSAQRRGRPTVMSLLGSRASVLLGDFWLVRAVARILEATRDSNRVIRIFADTLADLAEGEMLQLQKASSGDTQEADYQRIIYNKTASLFVAAALSAAISVQASPAQEAAVRAYAENLGMAFQIKDDIFDYQEDASIGKPVGQDLQEQKITLPLLGALQAAPEQEASVRRMVTQIGEHPEYQAEIVAFVKTRGGMDYAVARLDEYVDKAIAALNVLPQGEDRQALADLARFVSERKS
ncbi:MAG: polyprenyl synthetase family protein [Bacteroidales bacterium]|nr:polyprenyl synthetase family protein [Bacteroidales bacterium]